MARTWEPKRAVPLRSTLLSATIVHDEKPSERRWDEEEKKFMNEMIS